MIRKFFPLDKNYLLEEAQLSLQDHLLNSLITLVKKEYLQANNPLGIQDAFCQKIQSYHARNLKPLYGFYQNLAAVYRYKHGHNQLEFNWDGEDHQEKYMKEWADTFIKWTTTFATHEQFLLAVLDLTVFLPHNRKAHLAENRMNSFITQCFELKIHKNKGIVDMQVA
ncbi:MAG: hypothetical protein RIB47_01030 [Cyclobacteriaceae bacterium]